MQFTHAFDKPFKCINVEFIIGNYYRKKIRNALIRPLLNITIICQIYEGKKANYLLAVMVVAMSQRSFPHAQQLHNIHYSLPLWQCDTPKFLDLHASSIVQPPMLTSSPTQHSSAADIAPQDTHDPSVASPLQHTKSVAHALTQKTYEENQNEICPKPAQENIADGSVSSTLGAYHHNHATLSILKSLLTQTNSSFTSFFHKPFSCQAYLLSFEPHQEIPHGPGMSSNHTVLYADDKDMSQVINDK
jgi:hypothetical protein